jgi:hypothetical protein
MMPIMETVITYGIIYLLVFRLAVLLLGGLCIFYGYRLFLLRWQQPSRSGTTDQGGELHGKISGSELTIKSTAPGIFFSAFGAVIVIAVLAGSQPEIKYNEKQHSPQTGETVQERSTSLRSLPPSSAVSADAGTVEYNTIRRRLSESIDELKTAVSLAPDNPDYRDLLARLLFAWGEPGKAAAEQRRAVDKVDAARKADFQARLYLYEQAARAGA